MVRDLLGDERRGGLGGLVRPGGEEELAEEGVEGFADGFCGGWGRFGVVGGGDCGDLRGLGRVAPRWGVVDADVELAAQGDEEPAQDEQGALLGVGFEGGSGEGGGALGPAVADFDDGGGREEGGRPGYVGEITLDGAEKLDGVTQVRESCCGG